MKKTVVFIPTYNEAENIGPLIKAILKQPVEDLEILVVDDDSPDGTGELVEKAADSDPRVHLLIRARDRGRGRAGREGFLRALELNAGRIVEMDGDFSHDPAAIPDFIRASEEAGVVVGSRFIPGGKARGRGFGRDLLSTLARNYIRKVLKLPVSDPTSGYRLFTAAALETIDPKTLRSPDPFIVTEVLFRAHRRGLKIKEIPIIFRDRRWGKSKLKITTLVKYISRVRQLKIGGEINE